MDKKVTEEMMLLRNAAIEINGLRRQNEHMRTRLDMFDSMMLLFTSSPKCMGSAHSPDVVYEIDSYIQRKEREFDEPVDSGENKKEEG